MGARFEENEKVDWIIQKGRKSMSLLVQKVILNRDFHKLSGANTGI